MEPPLTYHNRRFIKRLEELKQRRIKVSLGPAPAAKLNQQQPGVIASPQQSPPPSAGSPRAACHAVYSYIANSLIIAPEQDIKCGKTKTVKLSDNGLEKLVCSAEGYNAYLLFTHLAALLPKSSVIYFGEPGTGKTIAPETVSQFLFGLPLAQLQEATIYGNPELTNADILMYTDLAKLMKEGVEVIHPRRFMQSFVRIIDEVNRIPPSKLSLLYQVADREFATHKNRRIQAPPGPLFATANFKDSGNYEIPKPFFDRFDVSLTTSQLNASYLNLLGRRNGQKPVRPLNSEDLHAVQREMAAMLLDKDAVSRLVYFLHELNSCDLGGRDVEKKTKGNLRDKKPGLLCDGCTHYFSDRNICSRTEEGVSVRSYKSIVKFSRAFAWWAGKSAVGVPELEAVLPYALAHKLTPTKHAGDSVYANDRVSFVRDLFHISGASYDMAVQKAPLVRELTQVVDDVYSGRQPCVSKKELSDMLKDDLKKLDTPAKFGLAVAAYDAMQRMK